MINTYVINLDSRPDNWSDIKKHFKGTNFKLTRIPAVVKNVGAYGNFLSVIKALKLAKKKGLSEILILEDDCLPVKGFEKRWETIKDWLDKNPDKWDIYSGGAHSIYFPKSIGESGNIKFYNPLWSASSHWTFIPSRSYAKLLEHYKKYSGWANYFSMLGVDIHNNFFKTVISHPFMAYQKSGYSNIRKTHRNRYKIFKNAEHGLSRKVKKHRVF
jgi:GR25 family glycosyltransferase involved in LPS biosynthesis